MTSRPIRYFLMQGMSAAALAAALLVPLPARAADTPLAPQTKLRVTVVQWMPMKGAYEQWTALGGEFTVGSDGTVTLPVVGAVPVNEAGSTALADEISKRLQASIGMVDKPNTTVEIVEFPPVYVVGDVKTPGSYAYRAGMNVLQALALGGGEMRAGLTHTQDQIKIVGELRGLESEILRVSARIARLRTEMDGGREIDFGPEPAEAASRALAGEIQTQERMILSTRANELDRQAKSLNELRELLNAEIQVLEQKIVATDQGVAAVERELKGVTTLVQKGIAVASRQSDLERNLASYRADRLDQVTAVMRARQGVAEATRNLDGLQDKRQTDIASELQKEQAALEQAQLRKDVTQRLLLELLASSPSGSGDDAASFAIVRQRDGRAVELPAEEATALRPGDVVKVTMNTLPQRSGDSAPLQVSQ